MLLLLIFSQDLVQPCILHILYALFPIGCDRYVEPFGGSGAVLLGKPVPDKFEVFNDYNHNLVNLFRCMRDRPMEFIRELGFLSLNSRDDFAILKKFFEKEEFTEDYLKAQLDLTEILLPEVTAKEVRTLYSAARNDHDLRRAAMFLKLIRYSYSSGCKSFACQPFSLRTLFALVQDFAKRCENVVIENQDFEILIKHYDRPTTFTYCDPPYFTSEYVYDCGFTWEDHLRLYHALAGMKGKFLLSYNDCPEIRELYKEYNFFDFKRVHAVNLLNSIDNGHRRCIMVTNNEVSADEAKALDEKGYRPGDKEWDRRGIARYVTWPRTVCSIKGCNIDGKPLDGNYGCNVEQYTEIDGETVNPETGKKIRGKVYKKEKEPAYPELADLKMSDGFKTNAVFFKLSFLDKTSVALGRQFKELLPVLWMKGGAIGKCPALENDNLPNMLILPQNKMAVLVDEIYYSEFDAELSQHPEIQTVFIITDSETAYRSMIRTYDGKDCYQLYRDYLDNFRINTGR